MAKLRIGRLTSWHTGQRWKQIAPPARKSTEEIRERSRARANFRSVSALGYLQADLDPLGFLKPLASTDLEFTGEIADEARRHYCGTIGADFMHLAQPERRNWVAERMGSGNGRSGSAENFGTAGARRFVLSRFYRRDTWGRNGFRSKETLP